MFAIALFLTLLFWIRHQAAPGNSGAAALLLAQLLGFVQVAALLVGGGAALGLSSFPGQGLLLALAVLSSASIGVFLLSDRIPELSWAVLTQIHGLQALALWSLSWLFRRFSAPVLLLSLLGPGTLLLVAPFLLDGWLARTHSLEATRALLDRTLALNPWSVLCTEVLHYDLFKAEGVYRTFRVGEFLYASPGLPEYRRVTLLLATALFGTDFVTSGFRRFAGQNGDDVLR